MIRNISSIIFFIFFFFCSNRSVAQSLDVTPRADIVFQAGACIPVGDFGATSGSKAGFASTGIALGAELNYHVIEFFDLGLLGNLNINGFDEGAFAKELGVREEFVSATRYLNINALASMGFNIPSTENIKFYGKAYGGLLYSQGPEIKVSGDGYSSKLTSGTAAAFEFGLGVGVTIFSVDLNLRYMSAEPEYEISSVGGLLRIKQPTSVIQISAGYLIPF